MINIQNKKDCCGCTACVERCPKQCISLNEDNEGFLYPKVDTEYCIECGLCEKVCPWLNVEQPQAPSSVLAVKNKDVHKRMNSSSGGVFIALAEQTLAKSGVVFGAVYDDKWEVKIVYAERIEDVYPMMGSKYLQARMETAYQDAEKFLKAGREVLFTGSPCHIAGLHHFLRGKDYPNLLSVDFVCHGVPSPGVWRRYLVEALKTAASKAAAGKNTVLSLSLKDMPSIEGISFRDKYQSGWKKYCFVVRQKSASKADQNSVLLSDIHRDNPYMRGFLADIYLRPSCYDCRAKEGRSGSDLTIADFWGIHIEMPDFDDDKGVSLVLIGTDKGQAAFSQLEMEIRPSAYGVAAQYNGGLHAQTKQHPKRPDFFAAFQAGASVIPTVERILYVPKWKKLVWRVKGKIKRVLGK